LAQLGYNVVWCVKAIEEVEKLHRQDDGSDSDDDDIKDKKRPSKDILSEATEWLLKNVASPSV